MIVIRMRFLTGRFHATPWGHHVNEGVVEYPPSLWRLLRSLVATFYRAFPDRAHQDKGDNESVAQLKRILAALSTPPEYCLPNATVAHTRHYDQANSSVKFFDTFLSVSPKEELLWLWRNPKLEEKDSAALAELLTSIGTFGRAESWCEAELLKEEAISLITQTDKDKKINSQPLIENSNLSGLEMMRLLLPDSNVNADELLKILTIETADMRRQKQLEPTGSRWVTYTRPLNILQSRRSKTFRPMKEKHFTIARFALDSTVLPLVSDSLPFAEQARRALIKHRVDTTHSEVITGKTKEGVPLAGHDHAHYFATDEDGDGRLDHLTIYAPRGFDRADMDALGENLHSIYRRDNLPNVRLILTALATQEQLQNIAPIFKKSKRWRSVTPFSLPCFANRGGGKPPRPKDLPEGQLLRELSNRGLPLPVSIKHLKGYFPNHTAIQTIEEQHPRFRWIEFHTRRYNGTQGHGLAGFEIEFPEEVMGPIALGFACHFGLGLFLPVQD